MSLLWKIIQRLNPRNRTDPAKYYALDVTRSFIDTEKWAKLTSQRGGAKEGDILGILRTAGDVLTDALLDGDSVKWDRVGVWSASITSDGTDTPEGVHKVKKERGIHFRAATELRDALERADEMFTGDITLLPEPPA